MIRRREIILLGTTRDEALRALDGMMRMWLKYVVSRRLARHDGKPALLVQS